MFEEIPTAPAYENTSVFKSTTKFRCNSKSSHMKILSIHTCPKPKQDKIFLSEIY
jgi:hypothetical protein